MVQFPQEKIPKNLGSLFEEVSSELKGSLPLPSNLGIADLLFVLKIFTVIPGIEKFFVPKFGLESQQTLISGLVKYLKSAECSEWPERETKIDTIKVGIQRPAAANDGEIDDTWLTNLIEIVIEDLYAWMEYPEIMNAELSKILTEKDQVKEIVNQYESSQKRHAEANVSKVGREDQQGRLEDHIRYLKELDTYLEKFTKGGKETLKRSKIIGNMYYGLQTIRGSFSTKNTSDGSYWYSHYATGVLKALVMASVDMQLYKEFTEIGRIALREYHPTKCQEQSD